LKKTGGSVNHFQELASILRSYGLNDDVAHQVRDAYRSPSGKLWHLKYSCGRLARSTAGITSEKADLAAPQAWNVCSTCAPQLSDRLTRLRRLAYQYDELARDLSRIEAAEPTWATLGRGESIIDALVRLLQTEGSDNWHTEINALIARARSFIENTREASSNPAALARASAVTFVNGPEHVSGMDLHVFGDANSYSSPSRRKAVDAAWGRWSDLISSGSSYETALTAAKAYAEEQIGKVPHTVAQLPRTPRLQQADFSSLQEWLTAEWNIEASERLTEMLLRWQNTVEQLIVATASKPDVVVLCTLESSYGSYRDDRQRMMLAPFAPRRLATNQSMAVVRLPHLTAEWLDKMIGSSSYSRRWYGRVPAEATDTPEVLEMVAGLLDYNGEEMSKLDVVLDVARATLG
jgi:hypothetical protein